MDILDVVDEDDRVVGRASKKGGLCQAPVSQVVHILIFNDRGEMALQLWSKFMGFCPGHRSTTVGGHVHAGKATGRLSSGNREKSSARKWR